MKLNTFSVALAFHDLPKTITAEFIVIDPRTLVAHIRSDVFVLSWVPPSMNETGEGELLMLARRAKDLHTQYTWKASSKASFHECLQAAADTMGNGTHKVSREDLYWALRGDLDFEVEVEELPQ